MSQVKLLIDHDCDAASFTRGPACPPEWRSDTPVEQLRKMLRDAVADAEAWIDGLAAIAAKPVLLDVSRDQDEHPRDETGKYV